MARPPRTAPWDAPAQAPEFALAPAPGAPVPPVEFRVVGMPLAKGSMTGFAVPVKDRGTGAPVFDPKGRPKYRAILHATESRGLKDWERGIRLAAERARGASFFPKGRATYVSLAFSMPRPQTVKASERPLPTVAPDIDKLARAVLDGLKGALLHDDAQVTTLHLRKVYTDGVPQVVVRVAEDA